MKICRENLQNEKILKKANFEKTFSKLCFFIYKNIVRNPKFDCEQEYQHFSKTNFFFILEFPIFWPSIILAVYCQSIKLEVGIRYLIF
jgi:hypothetical protein